MVVLYVPHVLLELQRLPVQSGQNLIIYFDLFGGHTWLCLGLTFDSEGSTICGSGDQTKASSLPIVLSL